MVKVASSVAFILFYVNFASVLAVPVNVAEDELVVREPEPLFFLPAIAKVAAKVGIKAAAKKGAKAGAKEGAKQGAEKANEKKRAVFDEYDELISREYFEADELD